MGVGSARDAVRGGEHEKGMSVERRGGRANNEEEGVELKKKLLDKRGGSGGKGE